jgi:hypothetical protein
MRVTGLLQDPPKVSPNFARTIGRCCRIGRPIGWLPRSVSNRESPIVNFPSWTSVIFRSRRPMHTPVEPPGLAAIQHGDRSRGRLSSAYSGCHWCSSFTAPDAVSRPGRVPRAAFSAEGKKDSACETASADLTDAPSLHQEVRDAADKCIEHRAVCPH